MQWRVFPSLCDENWITTKPKITKYLKTNEMRKKSIFTFKTLQCKGKIQGTVTH